MEVLNEPPNAGVASCIVKNKILIFSGGSKLFFKPYSQYPLFRLAFHEDSTVTQ